ncbi:hypothetical protein [Candidatus Pantoea edessiphila]|nr:hypothetical protein [Candidatus Pantoea edessiphila]
MEDEKLYKYAIFLLSNKDFSSNNIINLMKKLIRGSDLLDH